MKRSIRVIALATLFAQAPSILVHAQNVIPIVPNAGQGRMLIGSSQTGNFTITQEETTRAMSQLIERIGQVQDNDRQFLQDVAAKINENYVEYVKLVTNGRLIKASQGSESGAFVDAKEYFEIINEVKEQRLTLESLIFSLTSVNSESLPSGGTVRMQNGNVQTLPEVRNINFKPIADSYMVKINELDQIAKNLPMKVQFANYAGRPQIILRNSGKTLDPEFNLSIYTPAQITDMNKKIQEYRVKGTPEIYPFMSGQAAELRRLIQTFITNYGSNERYRNRDDEKLAKERGNYQSYMEARNDALKRIVDIFYQRSYLRAKWGVQLGAIQPANYQQRWANVDKFLVTTESLRVMRNEIALQRVELENATKNIRLILKVVDERSTNIFGDKASGSLLVRANSIINFVKGDRPTAEALLMVMQLVAADIKEELLLISGNGMKKTLEFYQQRYQSTEENKSYYTSYKCSIDTQLAETSECKAILEDEFAQAEANNGADQLSALFNELNGGLLAKSQNMELAAQIEKDLMIALANSESNKRALKRASKL